MNIVIGHTGETDLHLHIESVAESSNYFVLAKVNRQGENKGAVGFFMPALDNLVACFSALRNASALGVTIDKLYKYEPGIGGGHYVGVVKGPCAAPNADADWFQILYVAREVVYQGKLIHHAYSSGVGESIRAARKHLELIGSPAATGQEV